jgi:3-hydroxyisobutyrate dehydrogenase-like beta-hydroxyacid dehydrogenase
MGGAIAHNLVERGWRVIGFDANPAKNAESSQFTKLQTGKRI